MASIWICNSWYSKSAVGCCTFACSDDEEILLLTGERGPLRFLLVVAVAVEDPSECCWSGGENAVHEAARHNTAIATIGDRRLCRCRIRRISR